MGVSSCERHKPPKIETCIINTDHLHCIDERVDPDEYDRSFSEALGYLSTSPRGYSDYKNYCSKLREDLIKCERKCR